MTQTQTDFLTALRSLHAKAERALARERAAYAAQKGFADTLATIWQRIEWWNDVIGDVRLAVLTAADESEGTVTERLDRRIVAEHERMMDAKKE